MQEAASFQSASFQQEFDIGKHRVVMFKDFDVLSDGKITDLYPFSMQHKSCSCFLNFQGRVQMHHFLGSMSMYLHMMESMVSSEPPPIDINLKSL